MSAKQHKRSPLLPIAAAAALLLAAGVLLWALSPRFPRLEVAGFRITEEEYLRAMYQARNDVLSDHAAAGISLKDWDAETALGDPRELVMNRALELLREYYAVGTLAVERGYLSDAGYDAMLESMEEVNRKRQEALDEGKIVTGLPHFSLNDYITYRASSIRLQFCTDAGNPEYPVTPEELRSRYEADRDRLYGDAPLEEVQSVVAQSIRESRYDALIARLMENTQIRGDLDALYRFTESHLP